MLGVADADPSLVLRGEALGCPVLVAMPLGLALAVGAGPASEPLGAASSAGGGQGAAGPRSRGGRVECSPVRIKAKTPASTIAPATRPPTAALRPREPRRPGRFSEVSTLLDEGPATAATDGPVGGVCERLPSDSAACSSGRTGRRAFSVARLARLLRGSCTRPSSGSRLRCCLAPVALGRRASTARVRARRVSRAPPRAHQGARLCPIEAQRAGRSGTRESILRRARSPIPDVARRLRAGSGRGGGTGSRPCFSRLRAEGRGLLVVRALANQRFERCCPRDRRLRRRGQ
jgi:hypothetical protein